MKRRFIFLLSLLRLLLILIHIVINIIIITILIMSVHRFKTSIVGFLEHKVL